MDNKLLLSIPECADRLSLGRSKLYELLSRGDIRAVRIGRAVRIPATEIERYAASLAAEFATV